VAERKRFGVRTLGTAALASDAAEARAALIAGAAATRGAGRAGMASLAAALAITSACSARTPASTHVCCTDMGTARRLAYI